MSFEPLESTDPEAVGPYRLLARLGAGGMGRVYLARSAGGRTVAVKVVRAELAEDADFRERFRREVSAAQAVSGPYTAPVVDADRDGPVPWLATAYVLGPSLTEAVATHGPLPTEAVRALGTGLAQALAAVHGAGLVHRDLKPSNVLLAADGPRVIDFGIARALDGDRMTSTGVVVGSPGFMCPEQAAGGRMGPAGDVFSLGSVLVFAATGAGPFEPAEEPTPSVPVLLYRIVHGEPDLSALPAELRPAIAACLARNPADRPTPGQLAALLGGDPVLARGGWLPAPVTSDIATHAAAVMDMETPARGTPATDPRAVVPTPTEISTAPTGTLRLGRVAPNSPAGGAETPGEAGTSGEAGAPGRSPVSRRGLLLGGAGALVAVAGGGTAWFLTRDPHKPGPNPPPSPSGSPARSVSPSPTRTRAPGVPPTPLWEYRLGSSTFGDPLVEFTRDLVLLGGGDLIALNLSDGKESWVAKDAPASHFALAGGTVSYGLLGNLSTVDAGTGALLWKYAAPQVPAGKTGSEITADIVLGADDRAVYAMCTYIEIATSGLPDIGKPQTPGIMAISRKDGSPIWDVRRNPSADTFVSSVLSKDVLLYTDSKQNLVARSATDGRQLWVAETDSIVAYRPVVDGERVYCSVDPSGLQAVALADGKRLWAKNPERGSRVWYSPAAVGGGVVYSVLGGVTVNVNGTVYTPPKGPVLIAHQAADGKELWRLDLPSEVVMQTPPALVKDTLFVPTAEKGVIAVDIHAHKIRWTFQNGLTDALPWQLASNGERLIAIQGDRVYALPPE